MNTCIGLLAGCLLTGASPHCVTTYGALGDGTGKVASEAWLKERAYPIAKRPADHTVVGIVYGKRSDDARFAAPADGDQWYSCEWCPDRFWHFMYGIARYDGKAKKWAKVAIKPGQTLYVQTEHAYYLVTKGRRLRKAYVPGVDTMDYVGIQEAVYANPLGRVTVPRGHYKLNTAVRLHKLDCSIVGENCHGTVVEQTGEKGQDLLFVCNYAFPDSRSRRPTVISDLTLVGNPKSGRGIALFTAGFYTIERVRFRGHGRAGLYLNSCLAVNVLQTYFRDCSLRTERWANCFTLDTSEMRGRNAHLWIDGMEVGTIKNLCIEGTTANEHVYRFDRCTNVRVCDVYTEVLGVTGPSVPVVAIGGKCEQMELDNCRFTMHRETPKSECLIDVAPGAHNILCDRWRVNRVDRPYPKIRNRSTRGVLHFNACSFAKIGETEGLVRFTAPQLAWVGTRPILTRDPRVETLCRTDSTVITHNLVAADSDCNRLAHFKAAAGEPRITVEKTGGYGDGGGCVRIEGKKGDAVEFDAAGLRPITESYAFPFWMMRAEGEAPVRLSVHLSFGKYYVPMPTAAWPEWRLAMILNGQDGVDALKKPSWRLVFDEPGAIRVDRVHWVQSPFYTPALWDEYNYVASR